ncbi:MAG TPA: hypothetical protein VJ792_09530 [Candidatus Nitrosotalea sp.]|nr:hypothetical protein [Candidatus Nitrosotalea sp.]
MMQRIWGDDDPVRDKSLISDSKAISIARKFLEQYHSPVIFRSLKREEANWMVSMEVGLSKEEIIEVFINAESGKITSYNYQ